MNNPFDDLDELEEQPVQFDGEKLNELAAENHSIVAVKATDGIVLVGYEHDYSPLRERPLENPSSLGSGIAIGWTGQQQDGQHIVEHARQTLIERDASYDDADAHTATEAVKSQIAERLQPPATPLLVSCVIASVQENGTQLLRTVYASGESQEWRAVAIGPNAEEARSYLEKEYEPDALSVTDALGIAVQALNESLTTLEREAMTGLFITSEEQATPEETHWDTALSLLD